MKMLAPGRHHNVRLLAEAIGYDKFEEIWVEIEHVSNPGKPNHAFAGRISSALGREKWHGLQLHMRVAFEAKYVLDVASDDPALVEAVLKANRR